MRTSSSGYTPIDSNDTYYPGCCPQPANCGKRATMTESQSPQDGSFAAPRTGAHSGTEPFSGSYLDSDVETQTAGTTGIGGTPTGSGTGSA
ncbi:hypothetical protein HP499_20880, partial [Paenarthrobacter sp. CM16]|nr:hypothetical protein [Paenarthrobacter sp. CM16]